MTYGSSTALAVAAAGMLGGAAHGGFSVEIVDPFVGDVSETFESFFLGQGPTLELFGGSATAFPLIAQFSSSFMGSTVTARTGALFGHATNPIDITFDDPVEQFGGWFATNSGASGGLVEFFDLGDRLIDAVPLDVTFTPGPAPYTWNGWVSTMPIGRVRVSSNGTLNGFVGYDDLQVTFTAVPAPPAWLLVLLPMASGTRRRRAPAPSAQTSGSRSLFAPKTS